MTRYPNEHKARTRNRIVRSAARLFRSKGFASASVESVMRAAGLTHGGFYAHFKSKTALHAEAVHDAILQSADSLDASLEGLEPGPWLTTFISHYLSDEHLGKVRDGCPLPSMLPEIQRAPKAVKASFQSAGSLRIAKAAEQFAAIGAADPEAEAAAMFAALGGALAMARAMPDAESAEKVMAATRGHWVAHVGRIAGA